MCVPLNFTSINARTQEMIVCNSMPQRVQIKKGTIDDLKAQPSFDPKYLILLCQEAQVKET